ncbi:MAG: IS66 family insertion sequence element accessory protein TnpB [Betaproteobacteria bacterium]
MIRPDTTVKTVRLCQAAVDFRKSINGRPLLAEQDLSLNPVTLESLYVFVNRQRDSIKMLY